MLERVYNAALGFTEASSGSEEDEDGISYKHYRRSTYYNVLVFKHENFERIVRELFA